MDHMVNKYDKLLTQMRPENQGTQLGTNELAQELFFNQGKYYSHAKMLRVGYDLVRGFFERARGNALKVLEGSKDAGTLAINLNRKSAVPK